MNNLVLEILIVLLLIIANGVLAMSEIAIVSARKARLQQLADAGNARSRAALELANNPSRFLATVQIGITLVGILAGAFGGATLAEEMASHLNEIPFLAPHGETIAFTIVVIGIAYFSLVLGELVPKRLALNNAVRIASAVAASMRALSTIATPIVWLLSVSTDCVIRLMGIKPSTEPSITPEEIEVLIKQGTESGVFEASEQDMIESVLRLDDRRASSFMTPRTHIDWLDVEDSPEEIRRKVANSQQLFFPVARNSLDNVVGIVQAKGLLDQCLAGRPPDLGALLQPPLFVPERLSALRVLELFKHKGAHIALIIDEYGGIEGLVTHNNILEGIAGYVSSTSELAVPQAMRRADGSWLVDGLLQIAELEELLDIEGLAAEERIQYQTVGGFVIAHVGSIPTAGQYFEWRGLRFEVVDMDGRRVDKVLVTPSQAEERRDA